MKLRRVMVGCVLAAVTLSACSTHAGAAAQVGSERIETSTLREIVDRGMDAARTASPDGSMRVERIALQRRALTDLVHLNLLRQQADRLGVTVSGQDITAYLQAFAVLQFGDMATFTERAARTGVAEQDLNLLAERGALEFAIADKIEPDALAPEEDARQLYDQIVERFGAIPLPFESVSDFLRRAMVSDSRISPLVLSRLRELSNTEAVSVNPRFGAWSGTDFAVVAADGSIATKEAPEPTAPLTLG